VVTVHVVMAAETGDAVVDFSSSRSTAVVWNCKGDAASPGYNNLPPNCR
jgi:hypothetical protein